MTFLQELFTLLNQSTPYAVLRNWEGLPDSFGSRDIDLALPRKGYGKVKAAILKLAEKHELSVVLLYTGEHQEALILGNAKKQELLQLDFIFGCAAHGTILMDMEEILQGREFKNGIYHVSSAVAFLDKFLFNVLLGHSYPEKYRALKEKAKGNEQVLNMLRERFDTDSIEEVEKRPTSALRRKALLHSVKKHPVQQALNTVHLLWRNTCNWLFPQGISIGFTGPDGAGKTTVMEMVVEELGKVFSGIQLHHFRPGVFPNLGDALHEAGLKKEVDHDYSKPHRGKKTNVFSSLGRLGYYGADYILGYWSKVHKQLYRRNIVVFDRYYTDIITDSKRSRIFLPTGFLLWVRHFIPALKYNFLICADEETIVARKQELDRAAIHDILSCMKLLEGKKRFYVVDNSGTPQQAAERILEIIYTQQNKKYTG